MPSLADDATRPSSRRSRSAIAPAPALRRREPPASRGSPGINRRAATLDGERHGDFRPAARLASETPSTPMTVLGASDADLRALRPVDAPSSRRTIRAIAEAVDRPARLDFTTLAAMARVEAAHETLALRAASGIGPWTADIFLLFCLGHADAWPAGDLALQEAARSWHSGSTRAPTREGPGGDRRAVASLSAESRRIAFGPITARRERQTHRARHPDAGPAPHPI